MTETFKVGDRVRLDTGTEGTVTISIKLRALTEALGYVRAD